ncbi:L,D-transpeptidase family protein [Flavobacterium sp. DG1-102-2]|uniref:L,D-transpeptidase family protein n=1 Tax=Flavobacterium sp. DG1-102-2 TaxID=3081663 RepID=UPI002949C862|nr:L,D-transpeptidase family protein [Flavobacterium sp. DG1-102-2]MDV6169093.1 L,D-transpeptidase family protein [Flavobacterium sp. DG1-102-2]
MKNAALTILLFIFLLPSCKNTIGGSDKLPQPAADTRQLKNASHNIDTALLDGQPDAVQSFYKGNGLKTAWVKDTDRKSLLLAIQQTLDDGLKPADYNLEALMAFENNTVITKEECVTYDILLTKSFRKLASHLFKGKLKPYNVYYDWALPAKSINANKLLTDALADHSVTETLNKCRPSHKIYASLRKSMKFLNSLNDDASFSVLPKNSVIKLKDSGAVVSDIKARLVFWKDLSSEDAKSSTFDRPTLRAVKKFQKRHGIYPNGIVSGSTVAALNISLEKRKQQIVANLERWRWFANDFGPKALVINIPEFQMAVLENGRDTVQLYKVVVGKPGRRSPVLHSILSNLVINPTWTVPPTILKEDLTPSASEDRSYFANHNMKIYRYKDTIATDPEEWDPEKADHYRYVQGPGVNNSLGLVKFNFKNSFSVYLHDTNHRELFSKGYRALSSGCVRVQEPLKLAGYIIDKEDAGWTKEKLDEMIAGAETKNVGLKKETHVHQLYWTAWMDRDGVQFRNDIYNLDNILYKKLRQ